MNDLFGFAFTVDVNTKPILMYYTNWSNILAAGTAV